MNTLKDLERFMKEDSGFSHPNKSAILTKYDFKDVAIWDQLVDYTGYLTSEDNDEDLELLAIVSNTGIIIRKEDFTDNAIDLGIWDTLSTDDSYRDIEYDEINVKTRINMTKEDWYKNHPKEPKLLDN